MSTKMDLVCFVLLNLTFNLVFAKITYYPIQNFVSNNFEDSYETYDEDVCEPSSLPPHPDSMCCGVDTTSNNRIIGGTPTELYQYPWLVMIEYQMNEHRNWLQPRCGGSLISGKHVLTAAHCVAGEILDDSTPYNVILGDYDKHHEGPDCIVTKAGKKECTQGAVRIRIEKTIPHARFDPKSLMNDIALIKLKTMAPYTDAIRPICLPASNYLDRAHKNQFLYVSGWGTMKQVQVAKDKFKSTTSSVKRHVKMPFVTPKQCQSVWRRLVTPNHICAGGEGGKDSCMGDSGGPLMNENDGIFEAVGVVSFGAGDPCGKAGVPGVYTNVYRYRDWIATQLRR